MSSLKKGEKRDSHGTQVNILTLLKKTEVNEETDYDFSEKILPLLLPVHNKIFIAAGVLLFFTKWVKVL